MSLGLPYIAPMVPVPRDSRDNWIAEKPITQMQQVPGKGATPTSVLFTSAPKSAPSTGITDVITQTQGPMKLLLDAFGKYQLAETTGKQQGAAAAQQYKMEKTVVQSGISPMMVAGIVAAVAAVGIIGVVMMKGKS